MQHSRFVILTGHLNDYPLADLVGILRHQQKTGRLLIEYPKGPAMFYFNEGELVDAQLDRLSGLQAICVALAQPPSCFNFNPLIQPSRRSIESSRQKVISELLGCWDATGLEIETIAPVKAAAPVLLPSPSHTFANSPDTTTTQALVISSVVPEASVSNYSRPILAMAAAGLMMLGLSTVIAVTGGFGKSASSTQQSSQAIPSTSPAVVAELSARQIGGELSPIVPRIEPRNDSRIQRATKGKDPATLLGQSSPENSTFSIKKDQTDQSKNSRSVTSAAVPVATRLEQKSTEVTANAQSVKVVLQIEDGRVAEASIANHKPGMDAYEALALRIARQRRYPSKAGGQETVVIQVNQPR